MTHSLKATDTRQNILKFNTSCALECMKCGHDFETYEIASGFILELVKLRELVEQMKLTINKYQD